MIHYPLLVFFPTICFGEGISKEAWSLEGRSLKMSNQDGMASIRPPIFIGNNLAYWKIRTRAYLQSLGDDVWKIVEVGYQYPAVVPTDPVEKKSYETNAKAINALLGSLSDS